MPSDSANIYYLKGPEEFRDTFVLKTFDTHDAEDNFKKEGDAFSYLWPTARTERKIIRFYGSYIQSNTFHVILEYADEGSLEDYFKKVPAPTSGPDINSFWIRLFDTIGALQTVHESISPSESYQGYVV